MADGWVYSRRADATTSSASASAAAATYYPDGHGYGGDSFIEDLFKNKLMTVARGGSSGDKILRGFLIGVAIGLVVGCFFCCWYPCCGGTSRRRLRREQARRRRAAQVAEGVVGAGESLQVEASTETQSRAQPQMQPQTQIQETSTLPNQNRRPD